MDFLDGLTAAKAWPRRLLEVTTMTSLERQDGNMYGDKREPQYSILSYTWGRWKVADGPRLQIDGISWQVPAVNGAFTVEDFHHVLQVVGARTDGMVWVDIACIDQENEAVKMDEIGTLKACVDTFKLVEGRWQEKIRGLNGIAILRELQQSVNLILGDWWFSSLWTLQEAFLQQYAACLSAEGQYINLRHGWRSTSVATVMATIWRLFMDLDNDSQQFKDPEANHIGMLIRKRILDAGLTYDPLSDHPNIRYAAARFRKTTRELDRIYGIMAIYDIRVGAAVPGADEAKEYSLEELEEEFAAIVNSRSPLLGQYFIHLDRPKKGRTWQITQNSRMPWYDTMFTSVGFNRLDDCAITAVAGHHCARLVGLTSPLEVMFDFWRGAFCRMPSNPTAAANALKYEYFEYWNVVLDDYLCRQDSSLPLKRLDYLHDHDRDGDHAYRTVMALLASEVFGGRVSVVVLGEEPLTMLPSRTFGLLILHEKEDRSQCRRIGVCAWETDPQFRQNEPEKDGKWRTRSYHGPRARWERYEGVIH